MIGIPGLTLGMLTGGGAPHALPAAKRVVFIGDSQTAGRGTGTGSVNMDGARALSYPTKTRDALITAGYPASSESFNEANNTSGTLALYDPRVSQGTWTIAGGTGLGGLLPTKNVTTGNPLTFTPTIPVDTFEVYYPINTYGTLNYNIDGGASTGLNETGTAAFGKAVVSTSLAAHDIRFQPNAAATVFLNFAMAYNSAAKDFRIINLGTRNWSTTDWLVQDQPWRAFPGLITIAPSIALIMLGVNDFRTSGPLNSLATFKANMQTIITQCVTAGARVGLILPMPVDTAREGSFTQAQMLTAYQDLAATNACPLLRTDMLLGTWAAGFAAGQTTDDLHWAAAASVTLATPVAAMIRALAGVA